MSEQIDVNGVRIKPSSLCFANVKPNVLYSLPISVKNISRDVKTIRFYPPQAKFFSLKVKEHEKSVPSGLDHTAIIDLRTEQEIIHTDRVVITVEGEIIEIPVTVRPCEPVLELVKEVEFGVMVMANKVVTREIYLKNSGSKPGRFSIQYAGQKMLNIVPAEGTVPAGTAVVLRVEYVVKEAQKFDEKALVLLEGKPTQALKIRGEVMRPSLLLLEPPPKQRRIYSDQIGAPERGEDIDKIINCVKFRPTYYGTDRLETVVLCNNSPEPVDWVSILQEDAVGQEGGSPLEYTAGGADPRECTNPLTSIVAMVPNQGRLGPYQRVPVFFRFSPRWKSPRQGFEETKSPPPRQDFALFVRIQKVGGSGVTGSDSSSSKDPGPVHLEVAVTGVAVPVLLEIRPAVRETDFGQCQSGQSTERQLELVNRSADLGVRFIFQRVAHFTAYPDRGRVGPGAVLPLVVRFCPKQYGHFRFTQPILVLDYVGDGRNPFVEYETVVHTKELTFLGRCHPETVQPPAKFNPGVTPLITNEVGICAESRFHEELPGTNSLGPRNALITAGGWAAGGPTGSPLHRNKEATDNPYCLRTAYIAFPNDRTASIRPTEKGKVYRTILKRLKRHQFIDPDYEWTPDEALAIRQHRDAYATWIRRRAETRRQLSIDHALQPFENARDLGIVPGAGVGPRRLGLEDIRPTTPPPPLPNQAFTMLSSKELAASHHKVAKRKASEGINAVPTTDEEKKACSTVFTSQQLHQIVIGPSTVNFGRVCLRSVVSAELHVINNLAQHIHIVVEVDCRELRQSSPLSQVVPPRTKTIVPLIFESNVKGKFQRNVNYTINGYYHDHVIALAEVVPVDLELSTSDLELCPSPGQSANAGIRGVVTLYNRLNAPAEFLWEPVFKVGGTIAFSIRPKSGTVNPQSALDCEVVFYPSYTASDDGEFTLRVSDNLEGGNNNGNSNSHQRLRCAARLGGSHVNFVNMRVLFGNVPLCLTTVKKAVLQNTGKFHAFFRVLDAQPYPGITVDPLHGVVPVGGQTELKLTFKPEALHKFDCSIRVAIRGWKELVLRVGGSVALPSVDIVQKNFEFGGVFVGSLSSVEFDLINKTPARTLVEFDLTRYSDFAVRFPGRETDEDVTFAAENPGQFSITLAGTETVRGQLQFRPTEVATYDFYLPVTINKMSAPRPIATPFPSTPGPPDPLPTLPSFHVGIPRRKQKKVDSANLNRPVSSETITRTKQPDTCVDTPQRHITATAIREPVQLSHREVKFHLIPEILLGEDGRRSETGHTKGIMKMVVLNSNSEKPVQWALDTRHIQIKILEAFKFIQEDGSIFPEDEQGNPCGQLREMGEAIKIGVVFVPGEPGTYSMNIPVVLNGSWDRPYDSIRLSGVMEGPHLTFRRPALSLTPVPLRTEISAKFILIARHYIRPSRVHVTCPEVEADDGTLVRPLKVTFLETSDITPNRLGGSSGTKPSESLVELPCRITFRSDRPVSFLAPVKFTDEEGHSTDLLVAAAADHSLLTWYPFQTKHPEDYHIVCEEGKLLEGTDVLLSPAEAGEAQMFPVGSNEAGRRSVASQPSTTATSSNFDASATTSYDGGDSMPETESPYANSPREGALNKAHHIKTPSGILLTSHEGGGGTGLSTTQKSGLAAIMAGLLNEGGSGSSGVAADSSLGNGTDSAESEEDVEEELGSMGDHGSSIGVGPGTIVLGEGGTGDAVHMEHETAFDAELLDIVQRWFAVHGWPGGYFPAVVPDTLRSSLGRQPGGGEEESTEDRRLREQAGGTWDSGAVRQEAKTIYDMIGHLCGRPPPGIPLATALPVNPVEKVKKIYWQHLTLLTFIKSQGGSISMIRPEYLMEPRDYKIWVSNGRPGELAVNSTDHREWDHRAFERISRRAWVDLLLQVLKTLVLYTVTLRNFRSRIQPDPHLNLPDVNADPLASNCYSVSERILLAWLNHYYENYRARIWPEKVSNLGAGEGGRVQQTESAGSMGDLPSARWVINFDNDLQDGLVLAAVLGAHMPFLIESQLRHMYTRPATSEQCLHNSLKIVCALQAAGIEFDIRAIDITSPNPVMMLMLVSHLYHTLHEYIPRGNVEFIGNLQTMTTRQVVLANPTFKPLTYRCLLAGRDAADFRLPRGDIAIAPARGSLNIPLEFRPRFLRSADAMLLLVGRRTGTNAGSTNVFTLSSQITGVTPASVEKITSPCYQMRTVEIPIRSPFEETGEFTVLLIETDTDALMTASQTLDRVIRAGTFGEQQQLWDVGGGHPRSKFKEEEGVGEEKENRKQKALPNPGVLSTKGATGAVSEMAGPVGLPTDGSKVNGGVTSRLRSFFCHTTRLLLNGRSSGGSPALLPLHFLPFVMGRKQCAILFSNDRVGQFLSTVEANAELPLPTSLQAAVPEGNSPQGQKKSVRLSSAVAASQGRGGDPAVIYWRCEVGQRVTELLHLPAPNRAKESALLQAAQHHLSEQEMTRRRITGTLDSVSLMNKAIQLLTLRDGTSGEGTTGTTKGKKSPDKKYESRSDHITYTVELDSPYFTAPTSIEMPDLVRLRETEQQSGQAAADSVTTSPNTVHLSVSFCVKSAGVYPCNLIIRGPDDVRLYRIECMAVPEGSSAELQFTSPVHQPILQPIPLVNSTPADWPLKAHITGSAMGFSGPANIVARAYNTTNYPLQFSPIREGPVTGKLVLTNEADSTEHVFHLHGTGRKPLALDTIRLSTVVGEPISQMVRVPNSTKRKLVYSIESDLVDLFEGAETITVLPGRLADYQLTVAPSRRGMFAGILAFVADKHKIVEYDSDGDEIPTVDSVPSAAELRTPDGDRDNPNYRVWYDVELEVKPAAPQRTLQLSSPCQRSTVLEVPVTNPSPEQAITLEAHIDGPCLDGPTRFQLGPGERNVYRLVYTPTIVGDYKGSLIFYERLCGEFWFDLVLSATPPPVTVLEPVNCELGKWKLMEIELQNPGNTELELEPRLSNPDNFALQVGGSGGSRAPSSNSLTHPVPTGARRQSQRRRGGSEPAQQAPAVVRRLVLEPGACLRIPVRFTPSDLGFAGHYCRLVFYSPQMGDWTFELSGCGLPPRPRDPVCVMVQAGSNTTLLIPFHNPLQTTAVIDIHLTEAVPSALHRRLMEMGNGQDPEELGGAAAPFKLLLKTNRNLRLPGKTGLDIPISFAPEEMREHEALCCIVMRKKDGSGWPQEGLASENIDGESPIVSKESVINEIRWLFPIKGIPEASPASSISPYSHVPIHTPLIQGPARAITEERLEVLLSGVAPTPVGGSGGDTGTSGPGLQPIKRRAKTPGTTSAEPVLGGYGEWEGETFSWELSPGDAGAVVTDQTLRELLMASVQLGVLRCHRDPTTGIVLITFAVLFRPSRTFRSDAELLVRSGAGGVWRFPLKFLATEPEPDDVIRIEAVGLSKPTAVQIVLNSQDCVPARFRAYFDESSDSDFTVIPESGELPPLVPGCGPNVGLPLRIIYTPSSYGRVKQAKLIIQTSDMEWSYIVIGDLPFFVPPLGQSSPPIAGPHPEFIRSPPKVKNYIRANMKLETTAMSSPIKKVPILPRL